MTAELEKEMDKIAENQKKLDDVVNDSRNMLHSANAVETMKSRMPNSSLFIL